jgi:hypothetical protein
MATATKNLESRHRLKVKLPLYSIKIWLLLPLVFGLVFSGLAAEFEVEGYAVYDLYSGHDIEQSFTNSFVVSVRGSEWQIVTWPLGSSDRLECAKDTDCLRTLNATFNGGTNASRIWANAAIVEQRDLPSLCDPFLRTLWLTYCSSAYLHSATNSEIEPIWTLDNPILQSNGFRMLGKWLLSETPPYLPVEVNFLNDGFYRGYDRNKKQPVEIKLRPPYDAGYTCAVFRATSFTNMDGLLIPLGFLFKTSQTPLSPQVTPDMPRDVMFGEVQTVKAQSSIQLFRPKYQGEVSIHDYSVIEKLPKESLLPGFAAFATYKAYNGDWPGGIKKDDLVYKYSRKAAIWKKTIEKSSPANQASISSEHIRLLIIRGFFFLTVCVPAFLIFRAWKRNR